MHPALFRGGEDSQAREEFSQQANAVAAPPEVLAPNSGQARQVTLLSGPLGAVPHDHLFCLYDALHKCGLTFAIWSQRWPKRRANSDACGSRHEQAGAADGRAANVDAPCVHHVRLCLPFRLRLSWAFRSCLIGRRSRQNAGVDSFRGCTAPTSVLVQMAEEQNTKCGRLAQQGHDGCP